MELSTEEMRGWARRESERRAAEERPAVSAVPLGPLECYSDEYAPPERLAEFLPDADPGATGPRSRTVRGIICGGCCGWPRPPTSEEVYHAMRAKHRTPRQRAVVTVLTNEASFEELMNAHTERAFTWRQLARALAERGGMPPERARLVRRLSSTGQP